MIEVLDSVMLERKSQDRQWGEQNHLPIEWIAIIGEEFGEAAQQAVKANYTYGARETYHRALLREELLQLAAVTVAAIESHDREDEKRRRLLRPESCEDTIATDDAETTERTPTDG